LYVVFEISAHYLGVTGVSDPRSGTRLEREYGVEAAGEGTNDQRDNDGDNEQLYQRKAGSIVTASHRSLALFCGAAV
jgi:hypothetical protein